jgi:hypothetical protein
VSEITLQVTHPEIAAGPIQGFRFFWAYYVDGYKPDLHCQPCFKGKLVKEFCTSTARSGQAYRLDTARHKYVYVCGVGAGPKNQLKDENFHLPVRYAEGAR